MDMNDRKTFTGYAVTDPEKWSEFSLVDFTSKNFEPTDIEVAIEYCGVCGSDVHTLSSGWGVYTPPVIVGHEIVGRAVRVGADVKGIKEGDLVGVGAQVGSCYQCRRCKNDNENYCPDLVHTYNHKHPDGTRTQGGYSNGIIAHEQFVFPIPDGIAPEDACSMLCGGLTVYSPLVRNNIGPGKRVGIVGIGGLGHYAILFAKALGAEVVAFSHSKHKEADIKAMGADEIIFTSEPDFHKKHRMEFSMILSTRNEADGFPLEEFISMLDVEGRFITVGLPDKPIPFAPALAFALNNSFFGGSHLGSKKEAVEMLQLAVDKKVKPWIEVLPMKNAKDAIEGVWNGKVKYRYVLKMDIPEKKGPMAASKALGRGL